MQRVHLALSATSAAIQLLFQQLVYNIAVGARAFSLGARRTLRRGLGGEKVGQLRESMRTTMAQLPEVGRRGTQLGGQKTLIGCLNEAFMGW